MTKDSSTRLRARLRKVMESKQLNVLSWTKKAGIPESTLRNFLSGRSETITHATLLLLAEALSEPLQSMLYSLNDFEMIEVHQSIYGSEWTDGFMLADGFTLQVPKDPRGLAGYKRGFVIGDDHCDQILKEGDIAIVTDYHSLGRDPSSGDVVVLTITSGKSAPFRDNTTVRELIELNGYLWAMMRSQSPIWTSHVRFPAQLTWDSDRLNDDRVWGVTTDEGLLQLWGCLTSAYVLK